MRQLAFEPIQTTWGDLVTVKQGKYVAKSDLASSRSEDTPVPTVGANGVLGYVPKASYQRRVPLVTCRGSNCGLIQYPLEPVWVNNNAMALDAGTDEENSFIYYLALNTDFNDVVSGSAQPQITAGPLKSKAVSVPPREYWPGIAATLGALDDKIESNRRQISSLNRTGRSLYEAAIAENSISVPISTLVEHRPGKHLPKANYRPGSITVYGSNSVMGLHDTPLYEGPFAVMARIGSYCGSLHWTDEPAWVNNNASALLPLKGAPSWILRHALEAIDMSQFRVGTGQPFIAVKALMATALQMPAEGLQGGLNEDLRSISRLGSQRLREIDALSAYRDALLPELLSGRIRAADVEITQ